MPIYAQLYDCTTCTTCTPAHPLVHTYRHRGRSPPPEPKPVLHRPTNQYVPLPETNRASAQYLHRGERGHKEGRSVSRDSNRRRVHFADQPIVIERPNYPPHDTSATSAPSRAAPRSRSSSRYPSEARPPPPAPAPSAIRPPPPAPPPNARPTTATGRTPSAPTYSRYHRSPTNSFLHDLLASFPSGLWDMRRNTRPMFHSHYEPRYSESVFPYNPTERSIKLYFIPCSRMEFSWIAKVKADCRNRLTVNDVLDTISTELFRRSACRDLYEGHPCYSKVRSAHRIRTRRGFTKKPHYDDALRNIDLYHVDRGQALYFKGLCAETLRDGEVVYLVKFSYA